MFNDIDACEELIPLQVSTTRVSSRLTDIPRGQSSLATPPDDEGQAARSQATGQLNSRLVRRGCSHVNLGQLSGGPGGPAAQVGEKGAGVR